MDNRNGRQLDGILITFQLQRCFLLFHIDDFHCTLSFSLHYFFSTLGFYTVYPFRKAAPRSYSSRYNQLFYRLRDKPTTKLASSSLALHPTPLRWKYFLLRVARGGGEGGKGGIDLVNLRVRRLAKRRIWREIRVDIYEPRERERENFFFPIGFDDWPFHRRGAGFHRRYRLRSSIISFPSLFILQRVPKNTRSGISPVFICWKRGILMKSKIRVGAGGGGWEQVEQNESRYLHRSFAFISFSSR